MYAFIAVATIYYGWLVYQKRIRMIKDRYPGHFGALSPRLASRVFCRNPDADIRWGRRTARADPDRLGPLPGRAGQLYPSGCRPVRAPPSSLYLSPGACQACVCVPMLKSCRLSETCSERSKRSGGGPKDPWIAAPARSALAAAAEDLLQVQQAW